MPSMAMAPCLKARPNGRIFLFNSTPSAETDVTACVETIKDLCIRTNKFPGSFSSNVLMFSRVTMILSFR